MQGSEKKWIYLSYIVATFLCAWVLNNFLILGLSYVHWRNPRILEVVTATQLASVVFMSTTAYLYLRQEKINLFMTEVLGELKKVAWPDKKTAYMSTIVVVISVFIISVIMGLYDLICSKLIGSVLGI